MVGAPVQDNLLDVVSGHCSDMGLPIGTVLSSFSGVLLGVISVGSSTTHTEGEASVVLVPERSVMADRGERGIARSGTALSILICRLVLGREKECAVREARKLRRRFGFVVALSSSGRSFTSTF